MCGTIITDVVCKLGFITSEGILSCILGIMVSERKGFFGHSRTVTIYDR